MANKRMTLTERCERLERMVENMAGTHIIFYDKEGTEYHADWCPLCRLEKAEQIGSPRAIAEWVETTVLPMLAVNSGLKHIEFPLNDRDRHVLLTGLSAGDLLNGIANSQVLLGDD